MPITIEILRIARVVFRPIFSIADLIEVPATGQQRSVACLGCLCQRVLIAAFPNVDDTLAFQLEIHLYTAYKEKACS